MGLAIVALLVLAVAAAVVAEATAPAAPTPGPLPKLETAAEAQRRINGAVWTAIAEPDAVRAEDWPDVLNRAEQSAAAWWDHHLRARGLDVPWWELRAAQREHQQIAMPLERARWVGLQVQAGREMHHNEVGATVPVLTLTDLLQAELRQQYEKSRKRWAHDIVFPGTDMRLNVADSGGEGDAKRVIWSHDGPENIRNRIDALKHQTAHVRRLLLVTAPTAERAHLGDAYTRSLLGARAAIVADYKRRFPVGQPVP